MAIEAVVSGLKQLRKGMEQIRQKVEERVKRGSKKTADRIFQQSKAEVPFDTGALFNSGRVKPTNTGIGFEIQYGGAGVDYALQVHETQRAYNHGKWKYLEDPFKEHAPEITVNIRDEVKAELK